MNDRAYLVSCMREDLPGLLAGGDRPAFVETRLAEYDWSREASKVLTIGYWDPPAADPMPDFIVVADHSLADTYAWLSAFLGDLTPVSQWCRVWSASDIATVFRSRSSRRRFSVGAWVGAVLAECSLHAEASINLKETSGFAALNGPMYCAGRSAYIGAPIASFSSLADRYDGLSPYFRVPAKLKATSGLALWETMSPDIGSKHEIAFPKGFGVYREIFDNADDSKGCTSEQILDVAKLMARHFSMPDIAYCAHGPQGRRVESLDRIAKSILADRQGPASDALLGFSASLIDPGVAVLPELLRPYIDRAPTAPLWAGAFAGIWSPMRVLSEFGGLGRLIGRELTRPAGFNEKPNADIGYEELIRWLSPTKSVPVIRGLMSRILNVELVPGVTVPFSLVREGHRQEAASVKVGNSNTRNIMPDLFEAEATKIGPNISEQFKEIGKMLSSFSARLAELESKSTSNGKKTVARPTRVQRIKD